MIDLSTPQWNILIPVAVIAIILILMVMECSQFHTPAGRDKPEARHDDPVLPRGELE